MSADTSRRSFFRKSARAAGAATSLAMFPPAIRKALAIAANNRTGTLQDVEHIVIFTQENRSFDHYFGTLAGVRGFGDRFPIPVPDAAGITRGTVWYQRHDAPAPGTPAVLAPQHNDTAADFRLMRTADLPHLYPDAQDAWAGGRMTNWPQYKRNASMVYYTQADIPFQFALANAFTLCDASHCSLTGGTNPNRCFVFTGTNHGKDDPAAPGVFNGPALDNAYNTLQKGPHAQGYTWMTYAERLQAAGVSWQVYQDNEVEFYALNPLFGFKSFRDANTASVPTVSSVRTPLQQALYEKGIRTRNLSALKEDVRAGKLPQVTWICATSSGSEHPSPSSPAQGAAYTAQVLDALTANPKVWSKTALILHFDENDGFFDHAPPPAPPSYLLYDADPARAQIAGGTTVDAADEYLGADVGGTDSALNYRHHPYGLGPRVPMYVISPWSKGGWVNSEVFDHTSTIRFIEKRFGVHEPNISAWRRAVTGDLTSCFNFATPNDADVVAHLPHTAALDARSRKLPGTTTPAPAPMPVLPEQEKGMRPSRALPYELHVDAGVSLEPHGMQLTFANSGRAAAVFHVYDRLRLDAAPRRYTVEAGKQLQGTWPADDTNGAYDLWVLGPNGFHRHFAGAVVGPLPHPRVQVRYAPEEGALYLAVLNNGTQPLDLSVAANAYFDSAPQRQQAAPGQQAQWRWLLADSHDWYDFTLLVEGVAGYAQRFAGRMETGRDGMSDPAMGGIALGKQSNLG
jgi:phospholipase C